MVINKEHKYECSFKYELDTKTLTKTESSVSLITDEMKNSLTGIQNGY